MARKQNYQLMLEVHDVDEYFGKYKQIDEGNEPMPEILVVVELESNNYNDMLYIPYKRIIDFWSRPHAIESVCKIRHLWSERFSKKSRINKSEVTQFMFDLDSVIIDDVPKVD
jgi:hypothetical protein